ncbi:unnamed protein product [Strongylus vulgaris]|uniref:Uncharacterized protein n=1 Tax=Strongylus vulgaris TaxID=40348 RepID=A0A3P7KJM4_STRVU|nr:unnamed protein product [Strongylus vulgaris]
MSGSELVFAIEARMVERQHRKRHTIHSEVKEPTVSEQAVPESEHFDRPRPIRMKRQTCKTKASDDLNNLKQDFAAHCDRENM